MTISNSTTLLVATPASGQYLAISNGTTVLASCGVSVTYLTVTNGTTVSGSALCGPPTIETLRYYWVASDMASGVTVSNQWADRVVGNLAAQGAVAQRPTNSALGVWFDGAAFNLTNSTQFPWLANANTCSVFVVMRPQTPSTSFGGVLTTDSGSGYGLFTTSGTKFRYFGQFLSPTFASFASAQAMDMIITITNGINISTCVNTWYTNGVTIGTSAAGDPIMNQKYFGGDLAAGSFYYKGYLVEVAFYSKVLSAADIVTLHTYATNTYGYTP